jgi:tetratricopeptide (TPR) repeat protein
MVFEKLIAIVIILLLLLLFVFFIVKSKVIRENSKLIKLKLLILFGKNEKARRYALKIVDKYPRNSEFHKLLGSLYEKEGNINVALDEYIRAVELNNSDYEMHYKVAELLQKNERNDDAIIMLQDLLKMKPDYLEASKLLGNILYDEERFKEAVSVYMYALRYNPADYDLYYNLGMTFTRLNDFQKAKEYYKRAAVINTYLFNGQYNLALIAMIQGELDEAQRHLMQALQQEELEPMVYYYLAQIAIMKQEKLKAVDYLNLALELDVKIEEKIKNQPLFAVIQDRIRIPNEPSRKIEIKLSQKEIDTNHYLEEMFNLVDSLNGGNGGLNVDEDKQTELEIEENENANENEKERD